jgi:hypothetical protein
MSEKDVPRARRQAGLPWPIEFTREFEGWWDSLEIDEQDSVARVVRLLEERGPSFGRPFADSVRGSRFSQMKELRIQHGGQPYRVLFAFDPRRMALLLIGGNKTGDARWYEKFVPLADEIFADHLRAIEDENPKGGG